MLTCGPVPTDAARFLVALRPTKDLLLWAKYLFVAANSGKLPPPGGSPTSNGTATALNSAQDWL